MKRIPFRTIFGRRPRHDALVAAALFCACLAFSFFFVNRGGRQEFTPLIFVLAVLLISWRTEGYFYGIVASVLGIVCVNYLFTFPYMEMNFALSGYPLTFLVFLVISLITGTLTTQANQRDMLIRENEREKLRSDLLRSVSHDLRTPLTSIMGAASTLQENPDMDPEDRAALLKDLRSESEWLVQVMENLLSVTRFSGENPDIHLTPWAVEEVLGETAAKFRPRNPGIQVDIHIADDMPFVPMDPILIEQVLKNLMQNSAVHGKNTGRIVLDANARGEWAVFSVSDDGGGFPKEALRFAFSGRDISEKQFSDKERYMGIGLSVCQAIVKAHHGTIRIENTDVGAKVTFRLPLQAETDEDEEQNG